MRILAYFASGNYNDIYQQLPFDRVYLIDNIFRRKHLIQNGKVILIGLDCLNSIEYFKNNNILIDYFISLNEGLGEGGGSYAINSDMFLGYVMPLLKEEYYHMMYPGYYRFGKKTQMDLPFIKMEVSKDDENYFDPMMFSRYGYNKNAIIYKMTKCRTETSICNNANIKVSIIHDSIFCDYGFLDKLFLSIKDQNQQNYFKFQEILKVKRIDIYTPINVLLKYCQENKLETVGVTPWMRGKYQDFTDAIDVWDKPYPKIVNLYHLNYNDYEFLENTK